VVELLQRGHFMIVKKRKPVFWHVCVSWLADVFRWKIPMLQHEFILEVC